MVWAGEFVDVLTGGGIQRSDGKLMQEWNVRRHGELEFGGQGRLYLEGAIGSLRVMRRAVQRDAGFAGVIYLWDSQQANKSFTPVAQGINV